MTMLGFGQKTGQIMQMAYVVEDLEKSIDWWVNDAKTGPWFVLDSFLQPGQLYRGEPSASDIRIAMGFAGHMCIELIQPKDDHPSVYKEIIDRRGYGFHHIGIAVEDVDTEIAAYEARGYALAFHAAVPTGGHVAYLDDGRNEPGFIELIPANGGTDETFTRFWRASIDWNGEDPIRPFA